MDDWSPPLAWELHSEEGPRGDATWLGGRQLELNTGPGLKGMLEAEIAPMLDMPGIGELLTDFFAALRAVSGGAVWATPVPREILLSVLSGGARYQRNEFPRSVDPDTLLAWTLAGKLAWELSDKTLPGDPPMFKAGGTLRDRECWLVLASKPADPRLMFLSISFGTTEAPRFVEQRDRPFRRSALGRLFAHLRATVTAPPRKPRTGEEPAGDDDAEPHRRGYGYTPEDPIRLGGRLAFGAVMQRAFLEELRGPGGEPVRARRLGSTARGDDRGSGPLDIYEVTYDGQPSPAHLLLDMYSRGAVAAPHGFTRGDGISALIGKARAGATPGEAVRHAEAALEVARRKPSDGVHGIGVRVDRSAPGGRPRRGRRRRGRRTLRR